MYGVVAAINQSHIVSNLNKISRCTYIFFLLEIADGVGIQSENSKAEHKYI